ncbi:MAG: SRPBCC family protein [Cyclobacteriaceae bacterium]|nr:SRPBCC family protein [Cyclobacteriaceae bacterium]
MELNDSLKNRRMSISRLIKAPRHLVWEVWTNPEHIKHWWGPNGFTNTIHKMEVKQGGAWEFIMHGPDGTDYKNKNVFSEVVEGEKLVYNHVTGPLFEATITLVSEGDDTLVTMTSVFESEEQLKKVIEVFKADEGMKQNIDRLERYLAQQIKLFDHL